MKKLICASFMLTLILFMSSYTFASATKYPGMEKLVEMLQAEKFGELDRLAAEYRKSKHKLPNSSPAFTQMYYDLTNVDKSDSAFEQRITLIKKWKLEYPSSPAPYICLSYLYRSYAWKARTTTTTSQVKKAQWELHNERMKLAWLNATSKPALKDIRSYAEQLHILKSYGSVISREKSKEYIEQNPAVKKKLELLSEGKITSEEELMSLQKTFEKFSVKSLAYRVFEEGFAKDPDYYGLHYAMAFLLMERWHGTKYEMTDFLRSYTLSRKTTEAKRTFIFTLLALESYYEPINFLNRMRISWAELEPMFEEILRERPKDKHLLNAYWYLAGMALDLDKAAEVAQYLDNKNMWVLEDMYFTNRTVKTISDLINNRPLVVSFTFDLTGIYQRNKTINKYYSLNYTDGRPLPDQTKKSHYYHMYNESMNYDMEKVVFYLILPNNLGTKEVQVTYMIESLERSGKTNTVKKTKTHIVKEPATKATATSSKRNLLLNPSAENGQAHWRPWKKAGVTSLNSNDVFYTTSRGQEGSYLIQDFTIPYGSAGKYLVISGYAAPEQDTHRGEFLHPQLIASPYGSDGRVVTKIGASSKQHTCQDNCWESLWSIFEIPENTSYISVNLAPGGDQELKEITFRFLFDDLEARLFSTKKEAEAFIRQYKETHPKRKAPALRINIPKNIAQKRKDSAQMYDNALASGNFVINPSADNGNSEGWQASKFAGTLKIKRNHVFFTSAGREKSYMYQTMPVPFSSQGQYLAVAGYVATEQDTEGDEFLHPNIRAEALATDRRGLESLRASTMRHTCKDNCWDTVWGIFKAPEGTAYINLYLDPGIYTGYEDMTYRFLYDDLTVRVFDTKKQAEAFIQKYKSRHPIKKSPAKKVEQESVAKKKPKSAYTQKYNLLKNPTGEKEFVAWDFRGSQSDAGLKLFSNGGKVIYISSDYNEKTYLTQPISVKARDKGKVMVAVGYATVDKTILGSTLWHPFIKLTPKKGNTTRYPQSSNNLHSCSEYCWEPLVASVVIPADISHVQLELQQAYGDTGENRPLIKKMTKAYFTNLEVRIFKTNEEARKFMEEYRAKRPKTISSSGPPPVHMTTAGLEKYSKHPSTKKPLPKRNLLKNPKADDGDSGWSAMQSILSSSMKLPDGRTVFHTEKGYKRNYMSSQRVPLPENSANNYLLIAGYLAVQETLPGSYAWRPSILTQIEAEHGRILGGGSTEFPECGALCFEPVWIIEKVPVGTAQVSVFLEQSLRPRDKSKYTKDMIVSAYYDDLEVRIFRTKKAAKSFVERYKNSHPVKKFSLTDNKPVRKTVRFANAPLPAAGPLPKNNLIKNSKGFMDVRHWETSRGWSVRTLQAGNKVFAGRTFKNNYPHMHQKVKLPEGSQNNYIVVSAYASFDNIKSHPSMLIRFLDQDGKFITQPTISNHTCKEYCWQSLSQVQIVPAEADSVFLGLGPDNSIYKHLGSLESDPLNIYFDDIEVRVFDSMSEAEKFQRKYRDKHPVAEKRVMRFRN